MQYLTPREVIKKINGHPDCAAEFLLTNLELCMEDKDWAIKEINRSFKLYKLPMHVEDLHFTEHGSVRWKIKDLQQLNVAHS